MMIRLAAACLNTSVNRTTGTAPETTQRHRIPVDAELPNPHSKLNQRGEVFAPGKHLGLGETAGHFAWLPWPNLGLCKCASSNLRSRVISPNLSTPLIR
jgi:hypothetical protein